MGTHPTSSLTVLTPLPCRACLCAGGPGDRVRSSTRCCSRESLVHGAGDALSLPLGMRFFSPTPPPVVGPAPQPEATFSKPPPIMGRPVPDDYNSDSRPRVPRLFIYLHRGSSALPSCLSFSALSLPFPTFVSHLIYPRLLAQYGAARATLFLPATSANWPFHTIWPFCTPRLNNCASEHRGYIYTADV